MEELVSSSLEEIIARTRQQFILLQLLLQYLVDEELGVGSTEEAVVVVAGATNMSRPFLRPSNGSVRRTVKQEVPMVAEQRATAVEMEMLLKAE
jgi:hypothetical protein